ncbi:DUF559 domain-containing protein [Heliobacterium gestii]|uniref:DUF559 domain-containing protein n=1 Tax=Heliomicrobium gestii TaxID=2699 RepID=A0A845LEF5_HELGE|nr:AAA domain-containing protein [Heliomicrobium gestii]MBM7865674.1 very-short-patch-repair endonuclease [Heliomicrobium gestii]MZP41923.1 DUF559 domain-containing protein [Heliomicrobium gestii]
MDSSLVIETVCRKRKSCCHARLKQTGDAAHGVTNRLLEAVKTVNPAKYKDAYNRLARLHVLRSDAKRREELLQRLEKAAPSWAGALRSRNGIHGQVNLPGNVNEAWLWRQLNDELDDRGRTSLEELQAEIETLRESLRKITAELVETRAWSAQVKRTTLTQRQALQGWKQLMRRVGKGTGAKASKFMAEARKLMPLCQSAVPVWIMPLSRVAETYDPRKNKFDVVIIDEASQADVMALVALYMGRQIVVVGDHEQVSPTAVGQNQTEVQKLIDAHLADIPNAVLYDGLFSIYDLAKTVYQPVCLREHFRCVAPIIQFSNHLSYDGKIKPLRDDSRVLDKPPTVAYRVEGAVTQRQINGVEAEAIASLLIACTEMPEYSRATFGVISMVGDKQAALIDQMLRNRLTEAECIQRRIQCGNPSQFQGDERDVIFLSMVDSPHEMGGPLTRRTEGYQDIYKKRYNVAASRARDQMWVVYSLHPDHDLKDGDLRLQLIRHAQDPDNLLSLFEQKSKEADSDFEKQVLKRLLLAGYKVTPQWKVGAYRIDMVVEGAGRRLAIECDGDKYHTAENLAEDMNRQAILERLGWRFARIRGSQYFRNPDQTMQVIFDKLNQMDIPPEGERDASAIAAHGELKERVIRRAMEIQRTWRETEQTG